MSQKKRPDHPQRAQTGRFAAVTRFHRDVGHDRTQRVEVVQQVRLEKIAPRHPVQLQRFHHFTPDRGIAVGRIGDLPVTAGKLGEEGQHRVADQPHPRHALDE